jgi:hypothetical protein
MAKKANNRWSGDVKTVSTSPRPGLFAQDAKTIARTMASKKVSPKGIGSGVRMVQFFINRAGKKLSPERRAELEKAKRIMRSRAKSVSCSCLCQATRSRRDAH